MFLETLRCEGGNVQHLPYHQQRLDQTLRYFGFSNTYELESLIAPPDDALYRCRFLYNNSGYTVEYLSYTPKRIASLRIVHADEIDYPFKYAQRSALNDLYAQRAGCDDVLIVRKGRLTDTTIANVALYDGKCWLTPEKPLLEGTTRARLIDIGFLHTAPLRVEDIGTSQKIAVFNALMGFVEVENGIII